MAFFVEKSNSITPALLVGGGENPLFIMDEENKNGVGTEGTVPGEQNPAPEQKTTQQNGDALLQSDFPEEQEKQKQAFYSMRKKIEDLEGKLSQQNEDFGLVDMARGTIQDSQAVYQPSYPQNNGVFDETDPATQAFLGEAQRAKQEAVNARQEALKAQAQMEDFEAWQKYPQLNPKSTNRDKTFVEDVQSQYVSERLKALQRGQQPPRLIEVADKVQNRYEEIRNQAKEQALSESRATMEQKEAASLESQGTRVDMSGSSDESRIEELRDRVRRGDSNALTELNKLTDPYIQTIPDDAPF